MSHEPVNVAKFLLQGFERGNEHQVLGFPRDPASRTGFRYFTPSELGALTTNAVRHLSEQNLQSRKAGEPALVVGVYGPGTIEWVATVYAIVSPLSFSLTVS